MNRSLIPVLASVLAVQIGCTSNGVLVHETLQPQRYSVGEFFYAARGGEMNVDVRGNPFAMPDHQFADKVVADMAGSNRGPEVNYTRTPKGKGSDPYRVVMLFNGGTIANPDEACAAGAAGKPAEGKRLTLFTAFCNGDVALAESDGWANDVAGPHDPKVRKLVRMVMLSLVPTHDFRGAEPVVIN